MTSTSVNAAQHFGAREGFDLIAFREVGLPIYRLNTSAMVMVEKALPALQEFLLRAVDAELDTLEVITAFLGLEARDLDEVVFTLVSEGLLRVEHDTATGADLLRFTSAGREAAESLRLSRIEERTYNIDFDGLLRRPVPTRGWALTGRRLRELGHIEIPPAPPRRPAVEQIDIDEAERSLRSGRALDRSRKLLELIRINRAETRFIPATMLVFRAKVGDEVQVGFVIDGRPSEAHDSAFAAAQGPDRLSILADQGGLQSIANEVLGSGVGSSAVAIAVAEGSPRSVDRTEEVAPPPPDYEMLETFDHPVYLERALTESAHRLLIISPWIKSRVVDEAFIGRLRSLLEKGTEVYIGYGFGGAEQQDDVDAVRALTRLSESQPGMIFRRFGDTHAKVLISDESYAIVTSFNWLSFVGDPRRTFRDERGMLIRDRAAVTDSTRRLLSRFQDH